MLTIFTTQSFLIKEYSGPHYSFKISYIPSNKLCNISIEGLHIFSKIYVFIKATLSTFLKIITILKNNYRLLMSYSASLLSSINDFDNFDTDSFGFP